TTGHDTRARHNSEVTDANGATQTPGEPSKLVPDRVDYMPLIVPVTKQEISQFKAESRRGGAEWAGSSVGRVLGWVFGGLFLVVWLAVMMTSVLPMMARGGGSLSALFPLLIVVAIVAIAITTFRGAGGKWERLLRATRFAAAN